MGRFDEKIMLVTGATSGIGRAVAVRAAGEGATVIAVGRNVERGAAVVSEMEKAGGKGEFIKCDVSNKDAVKALFAEITEKYGRLDVAINNAGIVGASKTVEELEDDDWFNVIDANLNSCFFCCREEVKLMQPKGGAIVNVSSVAGMRGFPSAAAYVASKHAVSGLTKAVAVDYATKGITCNAVCPAGTDTPLTEKSSAGIKERMAEIAAQGKDPMEWLKNSMLSGKTETLQKKNATPEEQAATILYFASDEARHITGSIVASDGGFTVY
ncbi:MAG: SDR family NAD(P)-dependent oxidoreductase [Eubacteriales bacterium]|nr:SDR family NAD(P)-dependent oxidoreductase [Eubacteriales bacterium]